MARRTVKRAERDWRDTTLRDHQPQGAVKALKGHAARMERGRPDPATGDPEYSRIEEIVLRAELRYRQEHHVAFMRTSDYIKLFIERGWLKPSAITP